MKQLPKNYVIFSIIFIAIIVIAVILFFSKTNNYENNDSLPTPTTNTTTVINENPNETKDWKHIETLAYSFKVPSDANSDVRETETVVTYMGQKQIDSGRTQTELFDGYSFRISNLQTEETDLLTLSQKERDNAIIGCHDINPDGEVSKLEEIKINSKPGYRFAAKNCYGDYAVVLISNNGSFYHISYFYVGDSQDQPKYQKITEQILSTLVFHY